MNKFYRVVWNAVTGNWNVASELATAHTKPGSAKRLATVSIGQGVLASVVGLSSLLGSQGAMAMSMNNQQITDLANGVASGDAVNMSQLNNATRYFKAGGKNDGTDDASITDNAVAIGASAFASGNGSGNSPVPTYSNSVAIGNNALASGGGAVAIGDHANTDYTNIAVGAGASAVGGRRSLAIGINAQNTSWDSEAIGANASVTAYNGVALGDNTKVSAVKASALGSNANASAANSVALGADSTTTANLTAAAYNPGSATLSGTASTANGEVSIGSAGKERRVTNLAAGSAATDAVNVSQLQSEDTKVNLQGTNTASALGGGAAYNSTTGAVSAPSYALTNANSIAGTTGAAGDVGTGFSKVDAALGSVQTSINNIANGTAGMVQQNATTRNITVAKDTNGTIVDMTGTAGIANLSTNVSQNTTDIANLNTNVAQNTADITKNTTDISNINNAINSGNVGLVRQDATSRNITVAKDTDGTVVDMTGTQGARTVTGVAAGNLSADSLDAVNGSQLYATNQNLESLTQQVSNFSSSGTTMLASQNTDTPAVATGTNSTAIGNGSNASGNNSVALGSGSVADEDNTVSVGSQGNERRLSNVAPGVHGTDAANMNQLNAVQNSVNTVAREAFAGVAAAMAMPNLTPSQPGKTVVAAGVANYKGYTAMGIGGTYRSRDSHWLVNAAASVTPHGDTGVRGQVGYEF